MRIKEIRIKRFRGIKDQTITNINNGFCQEKCVSLFIKVCRFVNDVLHIKRK